MPLQNVEQALLCVETTIVGQDMQLPVQVAEFPEQYSFASLKLEFLPELTPDPHFVRACHFDLLVDFVGRGFIGHLRPGANTIRPDGIDKPVAAIFVNFDTHFAPSPLK
jgi:hypothetical protein